jgi:hypothetical protein
MASLLVDLLQASGLKPRKLDYIRTPKSDGYRAIHLNFRFPVKLGPIEGQLGCEIQIRSLLQHSWAELSRADFYASDDEIPPPVARKMKRLSKQLEEADITADSIRSQLARRRTGTKPDTDQVVSAPTLAFIYRQHFGQDSPEYLLRSISGELQGVAVRTDGLDATLRDREFQTQLRTAYAERVKWDAGSEQLFRWSIRSLIQGKEAAIRLARRDGREEWQDIERIARSEVMAGFPEKANTLVRQLQHPMKDDDIEYDIEQLASVLGGRHRCGLCGTTIIDPEEVAEGAVSHYKLRGKRADAVREQIAEAVSSSAVETGGWDHPTLCNYCENLMSKDD